MSDIVVVEELGATVVVQEVAPAEIVEVVAQGPQGGRGADGAQGPKGDTGDVTPAATAAKVAAEAAATSATSSATSATGSASAAATSATNAASSASAASASATQAASSATSASGSASTAATKASEASTSASNAATSAGTATTKAAEASTSATNAASSATSASNSASSASTSATSATASAGTATTKASEAATSATNAAASASTASTKASEASTSASNAATSATAAGTSATNAASSATAAAGSASSASFANNNAVQAATSANTSSVTATTKATEAATSATNAATSASTATTKASEAAFSATSAASAKAGAESARDSALAAYANFNDQYLGSKASDPTTDNTGGALAAGNLYYNTNAMNAGGGMKVYDGTVWLAAYASLSGALLSANNLSDLASAVSARSNLGLGNVENKSSATMRSEISSSNVTTALGFTPANAASLASVATSGSYADLINKPTLFSGAYADLTGKPTLFSGVYADLTGKPTAVSAFTNDAGYLTGITSGQVTTALGFTPYNATNPSGYITSSALAPYLTSATAASTYQTQSGMSSYLTTSSASSTYLPLAGGTLTGNLAFSGTGLRITGDFTNATRASRVMFQTSVANSNTYFSILPSGTATSAGIDIHASSSDPDNTSFARIAISATNLAIRSGVSGTGTQLPIDFLIGSSVMGRLSTAGNWLFGSTTDDTVNKLQVTGGASLTGSLSFSGTGQRITGDFSNATQASRLMFQTSAANGVTGLGVLPNGTSTISRFFLYNNSDPTNASYFHIGMVTDEARIWVGANGSGTNYPLVFQVGGSEALRVTTTKNFLIGTSTDDATNKLQVNGTIKSLTGGFVFPDGTTQTTAAAGSAVFPTQTGNAGKYLKTDGTNVSWGALPSNLPVYTYAGTTTQISVANGTFAVTTNGGSTVNVSVT